MILCVGVFLAAVGEGMSIKLLVISFDRKLHSCHDLPWVLMTVKYLPRVCRCCVTVIITWKTLLLFRQVIFGWTTTIAIYLCTRQCHWLRDEFLHWVFRLLRQHCQHLSVNLISYLFRKPEWLSIEQGCVKLSLVQGPQIWSPVDCIITQ